MNLKDAILARRSCRHFTDEIIPDEFVQELLESAMAGPSAHNRQPWEFYVVRSPELLENLHEVSRYSKMGSTLIIVVACNRERAFKEPWNTIWIQDCSAAIENMLLTATDLGLGSCWCGLHPNEEVVDRARKMLGVNETIVPMGMVQLGFPAKNYAPRTQFDPEKVHYL